MCSNELKDLLAALENKSPIVHENQISYVLNGTEFLACKTMLRQLARGEVSKSAPDDQASDKYANAPE